MRVETRAPEGYCLMRNKSVAYLLVEWAGLSACPHKYYF
jgi:hypothetical protein